VKHLPEQCSTNQHLLRGVICIDVHMQYKLSIRNGKKLKD